MIPLGWRCESTLHCFSHTAFFNSLWCFYLLTVNHFVLWCSQSHLLTYLLTCGINPRSVMSTSFMSQTKLCPWNPINVHRSLWVLKENLFERKEHIKFLSRTNSLPLHHKYHNKLLVNPLNHIYKYGIVETSEWIMCEINTSLGRFFELWKNHEPSSHSLNVSESKNCQFWSFQKSQGTGSFHQTIRGSLAGSLTLEIWWSLLYSQDLVLCKFWESTDKCVCIYGLITSGYLSLILRATQHW